MNNKLSPEYCAAVANEAAEKVREAPFAVRREKHDGKDVFVSVVAEAARKGHCLCIHEDENGQPVMCERLSGNLALEKRLEKEFGRQKTLIRIKDMATETFNWMTSYYGGGEAEDICPLALVNYALCICGGIANAVSRCPYYLAPKTGEKSEDNGSATEKDVPMHGHKTGVGDSQSDKLDRIKISTTGKWV
jgi:hypothetical protein